MKVFNPDKELRKIQKGNKNKIILGVISLLLIVAIGSSYALYQIKYNKRIIYTQVDDFSNNKNLAIYVDDSKQDAFPDKSKYYFDKVVCDNNSTWEFDYEKWELTLTTNKEDKCNIYFTKNYRDKSGANTPELYQGLIPIYFNEANEMLIADVEKEWYNYDEHKWGNAVLIDNTNPTIKNKFYKEDGTLKANEKITEEDILQMYVWIPRYKYELFNANNEGVPKQIINVKFESGTTSTGTISCTIALNGKETCENAINGEWYTHPGFTFGDTELPGIWVGKFEPSDAKDVIGRNANTIGEIIILPNKTSMINKNLGTMFYATRNIELENAVKYNLKPEEIDTHIMKNMEWGAVAYLTQSLYGIYKDEKTCDIDDTNFDECEVWINNSAQGKGVTGYSNVYGGTATGCVGDTISAGVEWNSGADGDPAQCPVGRRWNESGVKASTTGNMYGIYDMNGGDWENVMGVIADASTDIFSNTNTNGFNVTQRPEKKYYDLYELGTSRHDFQNGHLGDATRETLLELESSYGGWNSDISETIYASDAPFIARSGTYTWHIRSGIFTFGLATGSAVNTYTSFRMVLTAQDGEE